MYYTYPFPRLVIKAIEHLHDKLRDALALQVIHPRRVHAKCFKHGHDEVIPADNMQLDGEVSAVVGNKKFVVVQPIECGQYDLLMLVDGELAPKRS